MDRGVVRVRVQLEGGSELSMKRLLAGKHVLLDTEVQPQLQCSEGRYNKMPAVADYSILADGQVSLKIGGDIDHDFPFTLPNTTSLTSRAILSMQMEAEGPPNNLKWSFSINGTKIGGFTHSKDRFGVIQEIVAAGILAAGANTARVVVESGSGTLKVSDMVLQYQNNV